MSVLADGVADVYRETTRKARKPHTCGACRETIPRGARYTSVAIVFEGEAESVKRCMRCQRIHEHLRDVCDVADMEWPDERLNCGHTYESLHRDAPPDEIAALAFALPEDSHG